MWVLWCVARCELWLKLWPHSALVRLLSSVNSVVDDQVRALAEGLPAFVARERLPAAAVGPLVQDQAAAPVEGLAALLALIGVLAAVDPLVPGQVGALVEVLPTLATQVRFLPCVNSLMNNEI